MATSPFPFVASQFSWFWLFWSNATLKGGPGNRTSDWTHTFIYAPDDDFLGVGFVSVSAYAADSWAEWIIPCYYRGQGEIFNP